MNELTPINDNLLIELTDTYSTIVTPDKQFSTKTSGFVKAVCNEDHEYLFSKKVFFEDFKDGTQFTENETTYAFINYKDVRGYLNVKDF